MRSSLDHPLTLDALRSATRRRFLRQCSAGVGAMALASLLDEKLFAAPDALQALHFAPKAKNIIYLFQSGGPSHLDLFDPKPALQKLHGQKMPAEVLQKVRLAQIGKDAAVLASPYKFQQYGKSGMWLSELLPHLQGAVDDVCFVQGFYSEAFNHDPATLFMNTGAQLAGRPAMGSWFSYGLGSSNKDLPAFVVLMTGVGQPLTNSAWGSGFLPSQHQGVQLRSSGDPVLFVGNPQGMGQERRRQSLDVIRDLNQMRYSVVQDPEIEARITAYELAYRMQTSVPDVMDINKEPAHIHQLYGTTPGRASFANNCLLARRLVERGVRFVQLYHRGWDHHGGPDGNLVYDLKKRCQETDQPSVALIKDLKQRGLLDSTLILWGGEFGRTPMMQGSPKPDQIGRDHHPHGYTVWMAGGGIKPGTVYGKTDELGFFAVENKVHVHDLHATILHLFGVDHLKLTYRFQGRDYRLTDVHGEVVKPILA
ncbi:MAG: DUF1501 domain-containing protein [Verrucomicrobia bacterium]|nr:DUF1501 domain-containing protein [Verrucomicrobiota bacterium]MBI3869245.1 DUF1501 domain-containing protein [Verrucomicrobiota bacterium]